jgi:hypothetical protein
MLGGNWRLGVRCRYAIADGALAPPHRHQLLGILPELLRTDLDSLRLACGLNVAEPNGLGAEDQDGPALKWFGFGCQIRTVAMEDRRPPMKKDRPCETVLVCQHSEAEQASEWPHLPPGRWGRQPRARTRGYNDGEATWPKRGPKRAGTDGNEP